MAKQSNFKKKASIKDTEGGNFGQYKEGVGGGASPKPLDPAQRAPGVNSEHRQQHNNTEQARTSDGKFTYKSVNGKETKYPGRGKTVNPLLTGGVNGIKIEDADKEFSERKGSIWDKYKDKWYQQGSEKIAQGNKGKLQTKVAAKSIWEIAKGKFDVVKGELMGESQVFDESKAGAPTQEEKIAKQTAQKNNEETYVIVKTDQGIKVMKNKAKQIAPAPQPQPAPQQSPVAPSAPQPQPQQQAQPQAAPTPAAEPAAPAPGTQPWGKSGKFTLKDKEDFIKQAKAEIPDFDPNFWTDDTIEEFLLDDLNTKNQNNN